MKKYDLHTHTYYSPCSISRPAKILKRAGKVGLDGIAITDHNQVGGAIETVKLARSYVDRGLLPRDFEVIIGEEVMTDRCEVLVYYVKEKIKPGRYEDVIREVRKQGAVCSIAHPFSGGGRAHIDLDFFRNLPREFLPDAIETFNGRIIFESANRKAVALARELGLAETGGSDGHFAFEIGCVQTRFEGDFETNLLEKNTIVFGELNFPIFKRLLSGLVKLFKRILM